MIQILRERIKFEEQLLVSLVIACQHQPHLVIGSIEDRIKRIRKYEERIDAINSKVQ